MAITWPEPQGSEGWFKRRLGIPTASRFDDILPTKKGEPSASRKGYRNELVAERIRRIKSDKVKPNAWMLHGTKTEPEAAEHFMRTQRDMFGRKFTLEQVGLVTTDDEKIGCSPDRLVRYDGSGNAAREVVEIKCPTSHIHVGRLVDGLESAYVAQLQGQCLVGEYDVVHFYSYCSGLPPYLLSCQRDEGFIAMLRTELAKFLEEVAAAEAKVRHLMATGYGGLDALDMEEAV